MDWKKNSYNGRGRRGSLVRQPKWEIKSIILKKNIRCAKMVSFYEKIVGIMSTLLLMQRFNMFNTMAGRSNNKNFRQQSRHVEYLESF